MSKEGEQFILDLNLYLMSTGKSEKEIKEFIEEAEEHLKLGEEEGKSVQDIFGSSPEEYAKSVAEEIAFDKKDILNSMFIFIFGIFIVLFLSKIDKGVIAISPLELMADVLIYLVTIILSIVLCRILAFKDKKFVIAITSLFILNIIALVITGLLSDGLEKSIIINRGITAFIIALTALISLIISIKIKTFILFITYICNVPAIIGAFFNIELSSNLKIYLNIAFLILAVIFLKLESKRMLKEK